MWNKYFLGIMFTVVFTTWKHKHQVQENTAVVSLSSLTHTLICLKIDSLRVSATQLEYKNTLCCKKYVFLVPFICRRSCILLHFEVREDPRVITFYWFLQHLTLPFLLALFFLSLRFSTPISIGTQIFSQSSVIAVLLFAWLVFGYASSVFLKASHPGMTVCNIPLLKYRIYPFKQVMTVFPAICSLWLSASCMLITLMTDLVENSTLFVQIKVQFLCS